MISRCLGSRFCSSSVPHFSNASGSIVWLVYANELYTISQALSYSSYSTSINILINSTIASAGCVSFNCSALNAGHCFHSFSFFLNLLIASWIVAETNKYCYFSLSSFPAYVESLGYNTLVMNSARYLLSNALK